MADPELARTRSSTALSSSSVSSSLPSSPGPSVSMRGGSNSNSSTMRSSTPTASSSVPPRYSPGFLAARTVSGTSSSGSYSGASTSRNMAGAASTQQSSSRPRHARDRSTSNLSVATSSARTAGHSHARRQQTLLGGNPGSKLSRTQLATYNSSNSDAASGNTSRQNAAIPGVPDILVNGAARPEDVDLSALGRLPALSSASTLRSSPEATSIGVDGLFARFGVKEVRSIAVRGREKAESKREELRTMVGERYRDLLGAADSIVRMRRSSGVLLDRLNRARDECDREAMASRAAQEDLTRSHMLSRSSTPLVSGHTPYSVAVLVKLLLDCPEHIWRCIEREDYLSAARLDSIGRAVYRELVSAGKKRSSAYNSVSPAPVRGSEDGASDDGTETEEEDTNLLAAFPLVEQQFDTLDQLAPQISSRARTHLQAWDVPAKDVTDSLATLLMLDNISSQDALQLLLDQRSKTLSILLQDLHTPLSPSAARRPSSRVPSAALQPSHSGSAVSAVAATLESKAVNDVVTRTIEALALVLMTHEHALLAFSVASGGESESEPLLHRLLRLLQQTGVSASESPNATLSFIAQANTSSQTTVNHSSLPSILAILPNAHLYLRYLPDQIINFTPYIDVEASEADLDGSKVKSTLQTWFEKALRALQSGIEHLFDTLTAATQLASVRQATRTYLQDKQRNASLSAQVDSLSQTLDAALGRRFVQVYTLQLEHVARTVPEALEAALRALPDSPEDLDPVQFLFSSSLSFPSISAFPTLPAASTSTSGISALKVRDVSDPFLVFKHAIADRVAGRSPVLLGCMHKLETLAETTQADIQAWLTEKSDPAAKSAYIEVARQKLAKVEQHLRDQLTASEDTKAQLFVGALALHLALDSTFVQCLLLRDSQAGLPDADKAALLDIESSSTTQWRSATVDAVTGMLSTSIALQLALPEPQKPSRPSFYIMQALHRLAQAVNELGPHRSHAIPQTVKRLLLDIETALLEHVYNDARVEQLQHLNKASRAAHAQQVLSDVALLCEVSAVGQGRSPDATPEGWASLRKALLEITSVEPDHKESIRDSLLRSQNLLAPLVSSSYRASSNSSDYLNAAQESFSLVPLGQPLPASAAEAKLDLAKPGPRFALLPVNATAA